MNAGFSFVFFLKIILILHIVQGKDFGGRRGRFGKDVCGKIHILFIIVQTDFSSQIKMRSKDAICLKIKDVVLFINSDICKAELY